jgi:hypothetical protein
MADAQKLSPQQRAELFGRRTRKYIQSAPAVSGGANDTLSFDLVKVRLSSKIRVLVEADITVTHATETTFDAAPFAPFSLFNSVRTDINNGFSPFIVSGKQLFMYNLIRNNAFVLNPSGTAGARDIVVMPTVASSGGTSNKMVFMMDMPISINDRDPIALVMTQNQATTVTAQLSIGDGSALLAPGQTGFTMTINSVKVTPVVTSFSIPQEPQAIPALSTIKLVQATSNDVPGGGLHDLKLTPGQTFRKLAFYLTDSDGNGVADSDIPGNIELILNQSDFPYRLPASVLSRINTEDYGRTLPTGMFVFDFSTQGMTNYGGNRDYIDTERLTEFWVRLQATNPGRIEAVYETLTILRQ